MKRAWTVGWVCVIGWCVAALSGPQPPAPPQLRGLATGQTEVVDLSYAVGPGAPVWPGSEPFRARTIARIEREGYFARAVCFPEHFSTHLDAPAHFPGGRETVDQIPPERLVAPAVVIDVQESVRRNPDYRLTAADLQRWEQQHGRIPAGAVVLLRTGWASRAARLERYRNADAHGVMHFPGYSVQAAQFLLQRGVVGLGIDTLSVDYGPSKNFEVHRITLPAGLYHLENLRNLERLPAVGAWVVVAPLKLAGGSGAPVRVLAFIPR